MNGKSSAVGQRRQQVLERVEIEHGTPGLLAWDECGCSDVEVTEEMIRESASAIVSRKDETLAVKIAQTLAAVAQSLHDEGDLEGAQSAARATELFQWAVRAAAAEGQTQGEPPAPEFKREQDGAPQIGVSLLYLRALQMRAQNNKEIGDRLNEETKRMRARVRGAEAGEAMLNTKTKERDEGGRRHMIDTLDRDQRLRELDRDDRHLRDMDDDDAMRRRGP